MVAKVKHAPLIVIVGETASGKTALALELAERLDGEIICADSRTIYKEMDIGTAKPGPAELARIKHYCIDIVTPDVSFTAAEFKWLAAQAIEDIAGKGKQPIMVGGTGLYVDAVLYDFEFRGPADDSLRQELSGLSAQELRQRLQEQQIALPENSQNPRHLIRALETSGRDATRKPLRENTLIIGLKTESDEIKARIRARVDAMLAKGLEEEVYALTERYQWSAPGLQTIGYREWREHFDGHQSYEETKDRIYKSTVQYAKRQRTWFRRNNSIQWFDNRGNIAETVVRYTSDLNN